MVYIMGSNNTYRMNKTDFLAEAEEHAVRNFLRSHVAGAMSESEIDELICKGGLKTRRHLRDLTQDSLCDPFLSFLHPRPLSWAPAKILLEQIPQFLAKARRWSVQYDEDGTLSIHEETHLLEPPPDKRSDQGNAQGMIEPTGQPTPPFVSPFLSMHEVMLDIPEPVHFSPMIVTKNALDPSMSANPSGTSPTLRQKWKKKLIKSRKKIY